MQLKDYLEKYDTLKNIKRFNMETVIEPQNLCDHGHGVGTLYYLLCKEMGVLISVDTLFMVMNHDFAEAYTSDLNRRVKDKTKKTSEAWKVIENSNLPLSLICWTDESIKSSLGGFDESIRYMVFQIADEWEAMQYCLREVNKGNSYMKRPLGVYMEMVNEKIRSLRSCGKNYEICCDYLLLLIERIDVEYDLGANI